jgi:hypothetical protein
MSLPLDVMYGGGTDRSDTAVAFVKDIVEKMEYAYNKVRENLGLAQERQKHYYDQMVSGGEYTVLNTVMLYTPAVKKAISQKFSRSWTGPYRIVKGMFRFNTETAK